MKPVFDRLFFVKNKPKQRQDPILSRNLQIVESRLRGALAFLRKTTVNRSGRNVRLDSLPWFLLIGAGNTGKTTLLANASVNFILNKKYKQNNSQPLPHSETCDWWATKDLVIVDVPGSYTAHSEKLASLPHELWLNFLDLVLDLRGQHGLGGIVIAVSVSDLMARERREDLALELRKTCNELRERFGHALPFYFTITKCDLLPGFLDFFSDCTSDELAQAWGITVPSSIDNELLPEVFIQRFNVLIKRLNQQLIARLHQERSLFSRIYIKEFPLQIEHLKNACADLLKQLTKSHVPFCLKGVYLTSAKQDATSDQAIQPPQLVLLDENQQALQIMRNPPIPSHAYFIKRFILHGLVAAEFKQNMPIHWQHIFSDWTIKLT